MKKRTSVPKMILSAAFSIATGFGAPEVPQQPVDQRQDELIVPSSSVVRIEDYGLRAHTNHLVLASPLMANLPPAGAPG